MCKITNTLRQAVVGTALSGLASVGCFAFELEMGRVDVADTFVSPTTTRVTFIESFDSVPVVVSLPTTQGGDPSNLRISNVTTTGFDIVTTEPAANDGQHVAMNTAYLAIEPGGYRFSDGTQIQAYRLSTLNSVGRLTGTTWGSLSFIDAFPSPPAVLANLQTTRNETGNPPNTSATPFIATAIRNVSNSGLELAIERAESTAGSITTSEDIGVVAIADSASVNFISSSNSPVLFQSTRSADSITGFDNGCSSIGWPVAFSTVPLAVASMNSRDGNNGGWARRCAESAAALGLTVDEDIDNDSERSHTTERAGLAGADRAFHASFSAELQLTKVVQTVSDPENGTTQPYAIPGATVQYALTLVNLGNGVADANSVRYRDTLPDNIALCVAAFCQDGGSVVLDDSATPTPTGVSLGAVRYSNNGGASFVYTPVPDADGFDPAVDAIEVVLDGTFAAISASGAPEVTVLYSARVN
ncbi:MAG: hypothetical protein AAFN07_13595 [Pseudomonadota bacterium]